MFDQEIGYRLTEICKAVLELGTSNAYAVFGAPGDQSLRPSLTLLETVPAIFPFFARVLGNFSAGQHNQRISQLLKNDTDRLKFFQLQAVGTTVVDGLLAKSPKIGNN